jgi:EipB-like
MHEPISGAKALPSLIMKKKRLYASLALTINVTAVALALVWGASQTHAAPPASSSKQSPLQGHSAVYELVLSGSKTTNSLEDARGRVLYEFSGSPCEGYTLNARQVSELLASENASTSTDVRSRTHEDAGGENFIFASETRINGRLQDQVSGNANRKKDDVGVALKQPKPADVPLPLDVMFPTQHTKELIKAAKAGQNLLKAHIYDGAENGQKVFDTLAIIGKPLTTPPEEEIRKAGFGEMRRWPVTLSYFDATLKGEQKPLYTVSFELLENGINSNLLLDYGDFAFKGKLASLSLIHAKPCQN